MAQHLMRFSAGELIVLTGRGARVNCDGHRLDIPGMQEDLRRTVEEPKEGLTYTATADDSAYGVPAIDELRRLYPDIDWKLQDASMEMYLDGSDKAWIEQWTDARKCFVGPKHLERIPFWPVEDHAIIPDTDCYLKKDAVLELFSLPGSGWDVIFFSACVLSEILIYAMHEVFYDAHLIDVGAFWDPYCGVQSRAFHKSSKLGIHAPGKVIS
jgi:hypothetical protein